MVRIVVMGGGPAVMQRVRDPVGNQSAVIGKKVVGSGATGAEYAHAFARFDARVHLPVTQLAQAFSIYPSMSGSVQEAARLLVGRFAT